MYQAALVNNNESPSYYSIVFRDASHESRIVVNLMKGQTAIISSGSTFEFQSQKFSIRIVYNENRVIIQDMHGSIVNLLVSNLSDLQNALANVINGGA